MRIVLNGVVKRLSLEIRLSGLLFYNIILTNIASNFFGYTTFGDVDPKAKLEQINIDPRKFKISFFLILIEHLSIIFLALMLFLAFSSYSLLLGAIWVIFRVGEGTIQIYNKKNYWRLFNIGQQYAKVSDTEQRGFIETADSILTSKGSNFTFAQILFSIGTFAYSLLFLTYNIVPSILGWFGIGASLIYGSGCALMLVKPRFKGLGYLGGLAILIFELLLGGWLLIFVWL